MVPAPLDDSSSGWAWTVRMQRGSSMDPNYRSGRTTRTGLFSHPPGRRLLRRLPWGPLGKTTGPQRRWACEDGGMGTSSEVSRRVATPAWAWAVAALCVLLLAPVIVGRRGLVNRAAPLQVAGSRPAASQAGVALAAGPRPAARPSAPARQISPKSQPARAAQSDAPVSASRRGAPAAEVDAASRPAGSAPAAVAAAPSGAKLI